MVSHRFSGAEWIVGRLNYTDNAHLQRLEVALPITDPRMMPMPRPLLSTIFRQGTRKREQKKKDYIFEGLYIHKMQFINS